MSPTDWAQGPYAGNHGALHVRQSRAPLWFAGPRVRPGRTQLAARSVDIAPTILAACDSPTIDGADHSGRTASERGIRTMLTGLMALIVTLIFSLFPAMADVYSPYGRTAQRLVFSASEQGLTLVSAQPVPSRRLSAGAPSASALARVVLARLTDEPLSRDELGRSLGRRPDALAPVLLELELAGAIAEERDGRLHRVSTASPLRGAKLS